MPKKVVVFGGCGFIGSYVVEELINNGYDVVVADLINSKYIDEKYFKRCDILDGKAVNEIVKEVDIVYNFAGFANLDDAIANPKKALELNVMGNLNKTPGDSGIDFNNIDLKYINEYTTNT